MSGKNTYRFIIFFLAMVLALTFSSCARPKSEAFWVNGFSAQSAGFQRLAVFTDFAVLRSEPSGKTFVSLKDSLSDATEIDDTLLTQLTTRGYLAGTHGNFFVGSYSADKQSVSVAQDTAGAPKDPPYHIDPQIARVEGLKKEVLEALKSFSDLATKNTAALTNASITKETAQKIGGNYHSSGIVLVLGQTRRLFDKKDVTPPVTQENIERIRNSFLMIGYFEAMSGRLVYIQRIDMESKKDTSDFKKAIEKFMKEFPKADAAKKFEIPPFPKFENESEDADSSRFTVSPSEIMPGFEGMKFGVLRNRGTVPFTKLPTPTKDTGTLMPGTLVRIIGHTHVYTKVVLEDGSVGWIPTSMIWIKK